jgi:c-di-GMP-binding flagellar brake protein YcgR
VSTEERPAGEDRRRDPRFESLNLVQCNVSTPAGEELDTLGRTLDISESGILLELAESLPALPSLPETVNLTVAIEDRIIEARGKVVHQKQQGGSATAGVEFSVIAEDDREYIADFLRRKGPKDG